MKKLNRFLCLTLAVLMVLACAGCGSNTTGASKSAAETAVDYSAAAGEYSFIEEVNYGDTSFETPWTLTLNEDGTYTILIRNDMMGDTTLTGTYKMHDESLIITETPNETDATILADFFNEDRSCSWRLDHSSMTASPLLYFGASNASVSEEVAANEEETAAGPGYTTVAYADDSASQVMDIYLPENAADSSPAIIVVHGGGFKFGDQEMTIIQPVIQAALADGYVVATVDYRKSGEAVYPAALADVKAAVRYLRANALAYGIDPERIALWGESAGAYLCLMTALTPEVSELNGDVDENLDQSSAVTALVDFYGPVEFYTMRSEYESWGDTTDGSGAFESAFLGVEDIYADEAACDATYWETYKDLLPADFALSVWIQVGDENDTNVPYMQSVNFADRLASVSGVTVEFEQIAGAGHEDAAFYTDENLASVLAFLDGVMK